MARASLPTFAPELVRRRAALGLTRRALAAAAGTHEDSLIKLEGGERQPSLEMAYRLALALGCTLNDFAPAFPAAGKAKKKPGD